MAIKSYYKNKTIIYLISSVIKSFLVALGFLMPIFFLNNITLQGIVFQKFYLFYGIMFIIIILFLIRHFFIKNINLRKHRLDFFVLAFVFISIVGTLFSSDKYHSFFGLLNMPNQGLLSIILLSILYFIVNIYADKFLIKKIFIAYSISSIIVLFWSIGALSGIFPAELFKIIPVNLIGTFSSLSAFLLINIPLFIIAFSHSLILKSKAKKMVGTIVFGLATISTPIFLYIFLYNYTKWIVLVIGLLLILFFIYKKNIKVSKKTFFLIIGVFVLSIIFLFIGEPKKQKVDLPAEVNLSYSESIKLAKKSMSNNFLFGTGLGTFSKNFLLYKSDEMIANYSPELKLNASSGSIFTALTTQGILGSSMFVILILVGIYLGAKLTFKSNKNNIVSIGLGVSALMFAFHSLFTRLDSDLVIIGIFIVILYFAYIINIMGENKNLYKMSLLNSLKFSILTTFFILAVLIGLIYITSLGIKLFLADMNMRSFIQDSSNRNMYGMQYNSDKVISRAPSEGYYAIIIAKHFLNNANFLATQSKEKRDLVSIKKSIEYAINFANYSTNKLPTSSIAWRIRGLVYENSGGLYEDALEKSKKSYENALKYDPKNVDYLIILARLKVMESRFIAKDDINKKDKSVEILKDAKNIISRAIEIKNNYGPTYDYLSAIEESLDNMDESIIAQQKALFTSKNNENYALRLATLYQRRGSEQDLILATKLLQQILKYDNNINVHFSLALLYERIGESNLATNEYQFILDSIENKDSKQGKLVEKFLDNVKKGKSNIVKSNSIPKEELNLEKEIKNEKDDNNKNGELEELDKMTKEKKIDKINVKLLDGGGKEESISKYKNIIANNENTVVKTGIANSKKYKDITIYYAQDFKEYVNKLIDEISKENNDITLEQNNKVAKSKSADIVVVIGAEK